MIKHTLEKIDKLIKEKEHQLPEILLKLLAFLLHYARKLEQKESEYVALDLYSDALKLFRMYIVEEPFKLTKITTVEINQAIAADSFEALADIFQLRNRFLKQLTGFNPSDPFGKRAVSEMSQLKWAKKLGETLPAAELLKKKIEQKKGSVTYLSEIATLMWYESLKGEYLVSVDSFIEQLIPFCKQYFPLLDFLDQNSSPYLKQLCDPDRKYFMTSFNCEEFFLKLREPEIISELWHNTQQKSKNEPFVSQSSMVLRLTTEDNSMNEIIGITGQKLILSGGQQKDVKKSPAIMMGSSEDCDIVLKNKYISRKQMVLIEEKTHQKLKASDANKYNFSIVCLSQTNFAAISYPYRVKAGVGHIFFGNNVKYQLLSCERSESDLDQVLIEDDMTLSILPNQKGARIFKIVVSKLCFLILSGEDKQKEVTFLTKNMQEGGPEDDKHLDVLREVFEFDEEFYFRPGTRILCKTANEIVENRVSRKVRLRKDMNIFLEDFIIKIE